jgi:UDP-N-acetylmuramoyl-tripeptide--D-alanyl-D-alanine ligase
MDLNELYGLYRQFPDVTTDSRDIRKDALFFALKGEIFNGNAYAGDAIRKGAAYAVIDDPAFLGGDRFLLVEDVLKSLQGLASLHRRELDIPVIAITGSNGKTTTKELAAAVLSRKFRTLATEGNLNNHIGVPLTLLHVRPETEIAILEMGANHPGEIAFLCDLARPGFGLITNIGKAHLEGFGGYEGVVRAKTELYRHLASHSGLAFLNSDDPLLVGKAAELKHFTYGSGNSADVRTVKSQADPYVSLEIGHGSSLFRIESRLYGQYNLQNILAAAAIGIYFGVEPDAIRDAIAGYEPRNNRSQVLKTEKNLMILDAYNANPTSMQLAIRNFLDNPFPEKMLILGDMLELGGETDNEHRMILDLLEKENVANVFLVGPVFTRLNTRREWICFQDIELARLWFLHHKPAGATILIKGSRGMKMETVAEAL